MEAVDYLNLIFNKVQDFFSCQNKVLVIGFCFLQQWLGLNYMESTYGKGPNVRMIYLDNCTITKCDEYN